MTPSRPPARLWLRCGESDVHPDVLRQGCCDGPPASLSCLLCSSCPGQHCSRFHFQDREVGTGEIRRLGDSPEVAAGPRRSPETAAPSPRARALAAPSVSPPGTHEAGQGRAGGNAEGPEWGGGRGAKSALSQAFFSPPAAPPGRTPCPQPPEPGRFLFLTPGAASCLSFELGCWLPTHSPSSSGPWACPLMGPSPQALLGVRLAQEAPEAPASGNQCPSLRPALPRLGLLAVLFPPLLPRGPRPGAVSVLRGTRLRGGFSWHPTL